MAGVILDQLLSDILALALIGAGQGKIIGHEEPPYGFLVLTIRASFAKRQGKDWI
jgi:hypothetical protein